MLFVAVRIVFVHSTPQHVITPDIKLVDENIPGDEFYSFTKNELTREEFEQTILGFQGEFSDKQYWNKTEMEYYRKLYSKTFKGSGAG